MKRGLRLKAAYILKMETASHLNRLQINKWISKVIHEQSQNIYSMLAKYLARHTKVVFTSNTTVKNLVNTRALHQWNMNDDCSGDCNCGKYPELVNPKVGHVYLKVSDLPEKHSKLKRILMVSSKNPVYQSNRNYLGIQISHVKAFL